MTGSSDRNPSRTQVCDEQTDGSPMPPNTALEPTPCGRLPPASGFPHGGGIVTPRGAAQRRTFGERRRNTKTINADTSSETRSARTKNAGPWRTIRPAR